MAETGSRGEARPHPCTNGPPRGWHLFGALRVVSSLTLLSRFLGLARDALLAALFGGGSWHLDTFLVAFTVPNLFRRMFGEGALASSFIPVFSETYRRRGVGQAWQFASLILGMLSAFLVSLTALGEVVFWAVLRWGSPGRESTFLLRLLHVLFPYLILVCVAALLASMLQAVGRFALAAATPALLNVCWITALVVLLVRWPGAEPKTWALVLASAVLISGMLQLAFLYLGVRKLGTPLLPRWGWRDARFLQMLALMIPAAAGGAVFQLNVLADRFIGLYLTPHGGVSVLYWGMRVTQFPLALVGIAMGTVAFAALSDYASREDEEGYCKTLASALNGVIVLAIPASLGLAAVAGPTVRLLFERGAFERTASERTTAVLVLYGMGIWAFCLQHVLTRAYYARKDMWTPVRVGLPMVGVNLGLNLLLVGPLAEAGLALATTATAVLQVALLGRGLQPALSGEGWRRVRSAAARAMMASSVMCFAVLATSWLLSPAGEGLAARLVRVVVPLAVGAGTYLGLSALLGMEEVRELLGRQGKRGEP